MKETDPKFEISGKNLIAINLAKYDSSSFKYSLKFLPKAEKMETYITKLIEVSVRAVSKDGREIIIDQNSDIHHQCTSKTFREQKGLVKSSYGNEKSDIGDKWVIGEVGEHIDILGWGIENNRPDLVALYESKLVRTETKVIDRFICLHFIKSKNEIEIALCDGPYAAVDIGIVPFKRVSISQK